MLRLPEIGSHAAYKQLLSQRIHNRRFKHFRMKSASWLKCSYALTSHLLTKSCAPFYSEEGRPAWLPSSMLRSYLLSILLRSTSFVDWAERLRSNESLAILSGFSLDHTPSFGAFYDFFHRL